MFLVMNLAREAYGSGLGPRYMASRQVCSHQSLAAALSARCRRETSAWIRMRPDASRATESRREQNWRGPGPLHEPGGHPGAAPCILTLRRPTLTSLYIRLNKRYCTGKDWDSHTARFLPYAAEADAAGRTSHDHEGLLDRCTQPSPSVDDKRLDSPRPKAVAVFLGRAIH